MKVAYLLIASLLLISMLSVPIFSKEDGFASKNFNLYDESRNRSIPTTVYYPVNGKNFPVIIVSHGGGGNGTSLITHAKYLASNGYVVIVPEHVGSNKDHLEQLMKNGYSFWQALKQIAGNTTEWENRPKDVKFVIDTAHKWNASDEDLKGEMDLRKIGILGHSYGAYTVMAVMGALIKMPYGITSFDDKRIKAGIAISPQGTGGNPKLDNVNDFFFNGSWENITKPISFFAESDNSVEWRKEPFNEIPFGDVYFVRFIESKHTDFADWKENLRSRETKNVSKELALRFFDVYLKGYNKSLYSEEYADSLCATNKIVTDIIWEDKLDDSKPILTIEKPLAGYLYIFDRMTMPIRNTVIVGKISVEANAYNGNGIEKVEFYVDNELKDVDDGMPYSWVWDETAFGNHEIKVIAYDGENEVEDVVGIFIFNL